MRTINPIDLGAPRGYSHGLLVPPGSSLLFVAGQIGWDRDQEIVSERFLDQFDQALGNVLAVVREAGGKPDDVCRITFYVNDKNEYEADLADLGEIYRRHMGRHFPAMTLVEVQALLEPGAKVEIEATAAIP